jgi:hypothetical protein
VTINEHETRKQTFKEWPKPCKIMFKSSFLYQNGTYPMGNTYSPLPLSQSLTVVGTTPENEERAQRAVSTKRYHATESGFVAHLLAVKHGVPEFRQRRTSSPDAARLAYTTRSTHTCAVKSLISIAA